MRRWWCGVVAALGLAVVGTGSAGAAAPTFDVSVSREAGWEYCELSVTGAGSPGETIQEFRAACAGVAEGGPIFETWVSRGNEFDYCETRAIGPQNPSETIRWFTESCAGPTEGLPRSVSVFVTDQPKRSVSVTATR
jgi:hypothetical protein